MKKITLFCFFILLCSILSAQNDSMLYHNGNFESQYGSSGAYPGTDYMQCVVRFTPPYYPAQLTGVRGYFRNTAAPAPFRFVIYTDPAGSASGPPTSYSYISPSPITNPADGGMTDTAYNYFSDLTSAGIIINSGDVYAGATQYSQINGFVGMAIDTNNGYAYLNRNWISTSQGVPGSWWQMINWTFTAGNWGVTAFFAPISTFANVSGAGENTFVVYPNPAKNILTIDNVPFAISSIEIQNVFGEKVFSVRNTENNSGTRHLQTMDVSSLGAGIYLLKINGKNSQRTIKFIRE